jgi:hypothetical protein
MAAPASLLPGADCQRSIPVNELTAFRMLNNYFRDKAIPDSVVTRRIHLGVSVRYPSTLAPRQLMPYRKG